MKLNEEAKSLIRTSLNMEENILKLGLGKWETKLKEYENSNGMSTETFVNKFNGGELGDEQKWFDWLFAYKAFNHIKNKLNIMKGINV